MEIGPINPANMSAPVNISQPGQDQTAMVRQIVTAIRGLNQSELLGQGRELAFRRDPATQHPIIQIVEHDSGEVIDQIPPETVLRLAEQLTPKSEHGE